MNFTLKYPRNNFDLSFPRKTLRKKWRLADYATPLVQFGSVPVIGKEVPSV